MQHFWKIFLLSLLPSFASAQITAFLDNPSTCGLNIPLADFSCPQNSQFYDPNIFEINVLNAPGTVLGQDVYLSEVRLLLEHAWLSDMHLVLKSPGGQMITLMSNIGGNGDHFGDTSLVDCSGFMSLQLASCKLLSEGQAPFTDGPYRAEEDFYVFNDNTTNPNGNWELQICDDLIDDTGILQFVELVFLPMECLPIQDLILESQDTTSITYSYQPNLGNTAIVEVGTPGFIPGVDGNAGQGQVFAVNSNPFTLTGLLEDTDYDIYLRKTCNGGLDFSANSCGDSFKTGCNPSPATELETFDAEQDCTPFCANSCTLNGDWRNVSNDDFDWISFSGPTPTLNNTGPDDDVTGGGQYVYIETNGSQCVEGATAYLQSACFELDKQGSDTCHLSFSYHMKGINIGTLRVDASNDGGLSWSVIWTKSGHQGSDWNKAYLGLKAFQDGDMMQLRIAASKGNGVYGDIAIDDIKLHGSVFNGFPTNILYTDADNDGYGEDGVGLLTCLEVAPENYAFNSQDCNDGDPLIHPDADEIPCNGVDENCNSTTLDDDVILPTPMVTSDTVCSGELPVISAEADPLFNVFWYTAEDKSSGVVGIGHSFSPVLPINNSSFPIIYTFYAEVTDFVCSNPVLGVANVTVLPNPKGVIVGEEPAICPGESVDLAGVNIQDANFTGSSLSFHDTWPTMPGNELSSTIVEPLESTDYFYRLTSPDNCFYEDTVSVLRKMGPALSFLPSDSFSLCREFKDTIHVTATGGLPPYEYFWSTGRWSTSQPVQGNFVAGTIDVYGITVTDNEGCFTLDSVIVNTTNSIDSLRVITDDVTTCDGSDGMITIVPLNGQSPFAYTWEDAEGNSASDNSILDTIRITNLPQNAYRLTITDSSPEGCEVFLRNIRVQGPGFQISDTEFTNPSCAGFSDGEICLDVSGSGGLTYLWSDGQTDACASDLVAGMYSVTISNGDCTTIEEYVLSEPDSLLIIAQTEMPSCAESADGQIDILAFGGTPNYNFEWGSGQMISSLEAIGGGMYPLTLTDFNNCIVDTVITLNTPDTLSVKIDTLVDVSCLGLANGWTRISGLGGTPPYQYLWDDQSTSPQRVGLDTGTYSVTLTDFNNCSTIETITIVQPDSLILSLSSSIQPICRGDATGSLSLMPLGGTPPYQYHWNDGLITNMSTRTGLEVGVYWVVVEDGNACMSDSLHVNLEPASSLSISAQLSSPTCVGQEDGAILLDVGGVAPLIFEWSNGVTSQNLTNIGVGDYCVTVTDDRGCIQDSCFVIDAVQLFSINSAVAQPSCFGDNDGIIDQTLIQQGQPPFQFFWNDGSQHVDRLFLEPGEYDFTVTDANGCQFYSDTFAIVYPDPLTLEVQDIGEIACFGESTGFFETIGLGGTPPYSYNWVGTGSVRNNIYDLGAGLHPLILTDSRNCEVDTLLELVAPDTLIISAEVIVGNVCEIGEFDELISSVSGGSMPYSYLWSSGETTVNLTNPVPGDYFLSVTDANTCEAVFGTVKVKDKYPALILDSFIVEQVSCFDGEDASMIAYVSGGSEELNYHFSPTYIFNTNEDSVHVSDLSFFPNYAVTVTDEKTGCIVISDVILGEQPEPLVVQRDSFSIVHCFGGADGSLYVTAEGGTEPYSYLWTNDNGVQISQQEDLRFASAGIYHLTVTDDHNCMAMLSDSNVVTINEQLQMVDTLITAVSCRNGGNGSIEIALEGGVPPYSYLWSNDVDEEDISGLTAGFYSLTVTDSDTCRVIFPGIFVPQPLSSIEIMSTVDSIDCFGESTGKIETVVTGGGGDPYTYRWRKNNILLPSIMGPIADHLGAAQYQFSVIDGNNCEKTIEFTLSNPSELLVEIVNNPAGADMLEVLVSGGHPPYSPLWSTSEMTFSIQMLTTGLYEVLVTDDLDCEQEASYLLTSIEADLYQKNKLLIYPNPTRGTFHVELPDGVFEKGTQLLIFDNTGRSVWSSSLDVMQEKVMINSGLPKGIYQLVVRMPSGLVFVTRINFI